MQYKAGDTRVIGGIPYVRDEAGTWSPNAPTSTPGMQVFGSPDPTFAPKVVTEQYKARSAPFDYSKAQSDASKAATDAATAAATADAQRRKMLADAAAAEAAARNANSGLTNENRASLRGQLLGARTLQRKIDEVGSRYKKDFAGGGPSALVEYLPGQLRPENAQFNDASNGLMGDLAAAYGLTAQQQNTPAELKIRFGPLLPKAGDRDEQIEAKVKRLRTLAIDQQIAAAKQLGEPIDIPQDEFLQRIRQMVIDDDNPDRIEEYWRLTGRDFTDHNRKQIIENLAARKQGYQQSPDVRTDPNAQPPAGGGGPGPLSQLWDSTKNVGAGLIEGSPIGLADMAAQGVGSLMAFPADLLGFDNVANQLRNPAQVHNVTEKVAPVPQDWNGWGQRQAARFVGGGMVPAKYANQITDSLVGRVPPRPPSPTGRPPRDIMDDAAKLGIKPTGTSVGGPIARRLTSAVAQTLPGARPTIAGAERMIGQGKAALGTIAAKEGAAVGAEEMGNIAARGALAYRSSSRDQIGAMYDRARQLAGDTKVIPQRAIAQLDQNLEELGAVPMGGEAQSYLGALRTELAERFPDGVTIDGLRGLRTQLRDKFLKDGLRGSDVERRVNGVVDTISQDIETSLMQAGKVGAAKTYAQADQAWRIRAQTIDDVVMPIIGKRGEKSGEQVAAALTAATRGNGARFKAFVSSLPPEEAGTVRASLIEAMGRARPGAQDAAGESFSFDMFLTNWNQVKGTARTALFSEGDERAMDSLARVADQVKQATRYANHSNTGGAVANIGMGSAAMLDPISTAVGAVGVWGVGKALASPGMARALVGLSKARTPGQVNAVAQQLTGIAKRNPMAAEELLGIRDNIMRAMNENLPQAGTLAASPDQRPNQPY